MANPICLSPLKFYDDVAKQSHRKSYAYGHISPLVTRANTITPFQFVVTNTATEITQVKCISLSSDLLIDITQPIIEAGLSIISVGEYKICILNNNAPILGLMYEGNYYLEITLDDSTVYYSEVFCCTNSLDDYLEIEYWNSTGNFLIKNGLITFQDGFRFKLYIKSELGKPEYSFEEEATKRLGYSYVESQVSKKTYKFNTVIPEFICDAMRIIRLCDNKIIRSCREEYDAITFEMETEWQTQGDLASVTCEFETDSVIANFGGFVPEDIGGDFRNEEYNDDFNNQ